MPPPTAQMTAPEKMQLQLELLGALQKLKTEKEAKEEAEAKLAASAKAPSHESSLLNSDIKKLETERDLLQHRWNHRTGASTSSLLKRRPSRSRQ